MGSYFHTQVTPLDVDSFVSAGSLVSPDVMTSFFLAVCLNLKMNMTANLTLAMESIMAIPIPAPNTVSEKDDMKMYNLVS